MRMPARSRWREAIQSSRTAKNQWMTQLTNFYKFRHENSDTGLAEYIAGVLKTPLPQ
jgi:hypothetical protein